MFKTFVIAVALTLLAGSADAKGACRDAKGKFAKCPAPAASMMSGKKAPNCKKGKLCGNSCISVKDICHK